VVTISDWMNEQTNGRSGQTAQIHNAFANAVGWQRQKDITLT